MNLEERVEQLEFQVQLLFNNSGIDRYLFETNVTKAQYDKIMDFMETMQDKLSAGEKVGCYTFEKGIYDIVPEHNGDYHFCESLAERFAKDDRWCEVFAAIYGKMPKHFGKV